MEEVRKRILREGWVRFDYSWDEKNQSPVGFVAVQDRTGEPVMIMVSPHGSLSIKGAKLCRQALDLAIAEAEMRQAERG